MKKWIHNLMDQFDFDWSPQNGDGSENELEMNEDRATLIYLIDTYNKNLMEIENQPVRKVRNTLDEFAKELMTPNKDNIDKVLFRFRQFFSSYRIAEYTYFQRTFDDFRSIIWDFVDQLSDDLTQEQAEDVEISSSLGELKEAVESNSIDVLKTQSRQFIDCYIEHQTKRDQRRSVRMKSVKKNLELVKKKLVEANRTMRRDHLTSAFNRKSFDEQMKQHRHLAQLSDTPVSLLMLDIDHFKKINDTYGHAVGDYVLVELVKVLHDMFNREADFVARIGGEEFAILLPSYKLDMAEKKAQRVLDRVRKEVFVNSGHEIRFTVSIGVAQLHETENVDDWTKRTDAALYTSKGSGRDRYTLALDPVKKEDAA